jgi:hypothetical protein
LPVATACARLRKGIRTGKFMRSMVLSAVVASSVALAAPAIAQTHSLTDNLVRLLDAGDVKTVAEALQEHGYKAEIKRNDKGEPYILSGANGGTFEIVFYDCKNDTGCQSLDFYSWYDKDPLYTLDIVNEWNSSKRFLTVNLDKDGSLSEYLYLSAVGKTTYANFFDMLDWFTSMDGSLGTFLKEKRDKAAKPTTPAKK